MLISNSVSSPVLQDSKTGNKLWCKVCSQQRFHFPRTDDGAILKRNYSLLTIWSIENCKLNINTPKKQSPNQKTPLPKPSSPPKPTEKNILQNFMLAKEFKEIDLDSFKGFYKYSLKKRNASENRSFHTSEE